LTDRAVDIVLDSPERIVVFVAPSGYGTMDVVSRVAAADSATCIRIDFVDACSADDVLQRILSCVILERDRDETLTSAVLALTSLERLMSENQEVVQDLGRWIALLSRSARTFVLARRTPVALLEALADYPVLRLGVAELAVNVNREREQLTGVSATWVDRYVAAFGGWPRAWGRLREAARRPRQRLSASDVRELALLIHAEIDALSSSERRAAVTLAVFGNATGDEIAAFAALPSAAEVAHALGTLEGFVTHDDSGLWRMLEFPRQVFFDIRAPADLSLATSVIQDVAEIDPVRALVMALDLREVELISSLLAKMERSLRDDVIVRAEMRVGIERFLIDDQLFIHWWEAPRSRERVAEMVEDLRAVRSFTSPDVRWRRNLAIALADLESLHLSPALTRLESFLSLGKIGETLRALAYARLAFGFAWIGDAENFERLAPALDASYFDARLARLRYEYVRCLGDAAARRSALSEMSRLAAGDPRRERDAAVTTALDAFFGVNQSRFDLALGRLHALGPKDAALTAALSYLEGGTAPLALPGKRDAQLIAFVALVRASRESAIGERRLLLRAAMMNADHAAEVELRIAVRLAYVYSFPDDAAAFVADAEQLARLAASSGLQSAVAFARRGELDGPLLGLARRFVTDRQGQIGFRLGILDGTVHSSDNMPIAIGERLFELIAFLGLHPEGWADRDAIAEAIWPSHSQQSGIGALKTAVHRARAALGDPRAIVQKGSGYQLSPAIVSDVTLLESFLALPAETVARLGGLEASYATFVSGVERVRDVASRWPWFDRYAPRVDGILRGLASAMARMALLESKIELAHRIAADLRSLDDADETAFKIAVDAHRAAGNAIGETREIERYSALLRSFGADPVAEIARLFKKSSEDRAFFT